MDGSLDDCDTYHPRIASFAGSIVQVGEAGANGLMAILVQHPGRAHHQKRVAAHGAGDHGRDLASLLGHLPSPSDAAFFNQLTMPLQDFGMRKINLG